MFAVEVSDEKRGSKPVEPIKSWPLVPAAVALMKLPSPKRTPWLVITVRPIPPKSAVRIFRLMNRVDVAN